MQKDLEKLVDSENILNNQTNLFDDILEEIESSDASEHMAHRCAHRC